MMRIRNEVMVEEVDEQVGDWGLRCEGSKDEGKDMLG